MKHKGAISDMDDTSLLRPFPLPTFLYSLSSGGCAHRCVLVFSRAVENDRGGRVAALDGD